MTSSKDFLAFAAAHSVSNAMTQEMADRLGVKRARNWTQSTFYTKVLAAVEADYAQFLAQQARDAAEAERVAARDARAAERADVDAWIHANKGDAPEAFLGYALRRALATVEAWPNLLADYQQKLAKHPLYTLSWSGDFVQAAAAFEVANWLVEGFKVGATLEALADESLRETLRAAKAGSSRSTSIMSNLADDVKGKAWAETYERLSGKSFW